MTDNQYGILIETVEKLTADVAELKSLLLSNMEQINRLNPGNHLHGVPTRNSRTAHEVEAERRAYEEFQRGNTNRAGLGRTMWDLDTTNGQVNERPLPYDPINIGPPPRPPEMPAPTPEPLPTDQRTRRRTAPDAILHQRVDVPPQVMMHTSGATIYNPNTVAAFGLGGTPTQESPF